MAMLIQENDLSAISIHENIQKTDTELTMAQKVFESSISTLNDKKVVTTKGSKKAATIINESKRVYFFGVGGSEIVATDAYHKFCVPYRNFSQHGLPYSIDGSFFIDGKRLCCFDFSHRAIKRNNPYC